MHKNIDRLKLAVDTHHLILEHAGTKRVTLNILDQFSKNPDIELIQLSPSYYKVSTGSSSIGKIFNHLVRFFWVHIHLPILCALKKVDVLLSPEYNTPLYTHCKRVVIAHDAHMRAQMEFTSSLWFYCYYVPFIELAIRRADVIFTVSQFAKKQIVELMKLDERKVIVAYNGVDGRFFSKQDDEIQFNKITLAELKFKEYILFVGTFEARKNIERLLEAFAIFKKNNGASVDHIKLAIVGKAATGKFSDRSKQIEQLIQQLKLKKEIILCGYVPDQDLPDLYKGAYIIAFPSLHEGFGIPIIEGFASGVPVLTSNVCSMPEIAGDAALLADPYDTTDIANKLDQLMFDVSLREQLILAGQKRAREFTWERFADQMITGIYSIWKRN